ncbi:microfibril-associated glycoprotein 4-like [Diadema setosum]|uniref:microfibril-associated glycoprotein 4-like n=1 Tax=Diadema setosum TaxID=31175 RepID=UPI003B3AE4EE
MPCVGESLHPRPLRLFCSIAVSHPQSVEKLSISGTHRHRNQKTKMGHREGAVNERRRDSWRGNRCPQNTPSKLSDIIHWHGLTLCDVKMALRELELANGEKFTAQYLVQSSEMSGCASTTRNLICTVSYVFPRDCAEVAESGPSASGRYLIRPTGMTQAFDVYCDMSTDGGNWTLLQRRKDGSISFDRTWMDYKFGFGDVMSEHWLGNDKIYHLTAQRDYELRVELGDFEGNEVFAIYKSFRIDNETMKYRLHVSGYSGNAGDSLSAHNGLLFTSWDRDNDNYELNCAQEHVGSGWWYDHCLYANLNGYYVTSDVVTFTSRLGICWYDWKSSYNSMKRAEMKIRPIRPWC